MRNRGVTEILGFVLVFSLITASVGIVYVFGFTGLESARNAEQLENVERAFDVLADNIEDVHRDDAPHRATEIKLYDAGIGLGEPTRMTVTITNVGGTPSYSVNTYSIEYRPQNSETRMRYVGGAVFREDRNGAVFLERPSFVFREDASGNRTAVLPLIETRSREDESVSGRTTALVRTDRVLAEVLTARTDLSEATADPDGDGTDETTADPDGDGYPEYNVEFTIHSSEALAPLWEEYLDSEIETEYSGVSDPCGLTSPDTVECTFPVERLYVTATRIDVSFEV